MGLGERLGGGDGGLGLRTMRQERRVVIVHASLLLWQGQSIEDGVHPAITGSVPVGVATKGHEEVHVVVRTNPSNIHASDVGNTR